MKMKIVLAVVLSALTFPAVSAEYALMLNDGERAALIELIDAAVKSKGLELAPNAVFLANKIRSAGVVTERKEEPRKEEPRKEESKESPQ
jgi:hypothetical protein